MSKQITSYKGQEIESLLDTTGVTKAVAIAKMPKIIELRKMLKKLEGNAKKALNECGEYLSDNCLKAGQNCLNWIDENDTIEISRIDRHSKVFDDTELTDLNTEMEKIKQKIKERTAILVAKKEYTEQVTSTSWSYKEI